MARTKTIDDLNLQGKRTLVRVDFNVPLDADGTVTDVTRINAALPTIKELQSKGAKIILASHLGRPKGERNSSMSLSPVAPLLAQKLGTPVLFLEDCVGDQVKSAVDTLQDGQVALLENLRFHQGETDNDPEFAASLASLADVFVSDAFGTAHRAHASTFGVPSILSNKVSGYLIAKELEFLGEKTNTPSRPFVVIPDGWEGVDIGPLTIELYQNAISGAQTILWNGPMGVFEIDDSSKGTFAVAGTVANSSAVSIIGGGDSVKAINRSGHSENVTFMSTGGGASLEFLEGKDLPGVSILDTI